MKIHGVSYSKLLMSKKQLNLIDLQVSLFDDYKNRVTIIVGTVGVNLIDGLNQIYIEITENGFYFKNDLSLSDLIQNGQDFYDKNNKNKKCIILLAEGEWPNISLKHHNGIFLESSKTLSIAEVPTYITKKENGTFLNTRELDEY